MIILFKNGGVAAIRFKFDFYSWLVRSNANDVVIVVVDKVVRLNVVFDVDVDGQVAFTSEKNMSEKHTSLLAGTKFPKTILIAGQNTVKV